MDKDYRIAELERELEEARKDVRIRELEAEIARLRNIYPHPFTVPNIPWWTYPRGTPIVRC